MPLAAVGLAPAGQPVAVAILTVGIQEVCGAGRVGEGPKVCSAAAVLEGSLQEASGSASAPTDITSNKIFRMMAPWISPDNAMLIVPTTRKGDQRSRRLL